MANFMYQFLSKYDIIKKSKSMEGFIMNEEPELYSNAMSTSNTFFDFILDFKKETIVEDETGKQKHISNVAKIRISPQMAKALKELLTENIKNYEETFGAIPEFKAHKE